MSEEAGPVKPKRGRPKGSKDQRKRAKARKRCPECAAPGNRDCETCKGTGFLPRFWAEHKVHQTLTIAKDVEGLTWEPQAGDTHGTTKLGILAAVQEGMPIVSACVVFGLHPNRWQDWCHQEPELKAAQEAARERPKRQMIQRIMEAGKGDWRANAWLLERMYPADYGAIARGEIKHTHDHTHKVSVLDKMPLEGENGLRAWVVKSLGMSQSPALEAELVGEVTT